MLRMHDTNGTINARVHRRECKGRHPPGDTGGSQGWTVVAPVTLSPNKDRSMLRINVARFVMEMLVGTIARMSEGIVMRLRLAPAPIPVRVKTAPRFPGRTSR
jgi:hypothetical protein